MGKFDSFVVPALSDCWIYSSGSHCSSLANGAQEERLHYAEKYSKKMSRRRTALVQRILTVSAALFAGACVLALLVG